MSLILDALNRSESERATPDTVPGLQSVHGSPTAVPTWRKWLWLGLILALLAAALLYLRGDGTPEPPAAEPVVAVASAVTAPPPPAVTRAQPAPAPRQRPVAAPARARAPEPDPVVNPDVAALYQTRAGGGAAAEPAPAPVEPAAIAPRQTPAAPPVSKEVPPALDIDAMTQAAQLALAERDIDDMPVVEHEAPYISELRQSEKDQIPSIFYNSHSWASNPSERRVVLNGQERRAGQQVKPGLRLVEILEDSIVLDFRGTEFRLRSLNSWVNL